jgi:hypothetical protein
MDAMAHERKTTLGEWIGITMFAAGGAGVMGASELASRAGKLFDPVAAFVFFPLSLIGSAVFVVCYRRAERNAKLQTPRSNA